MTRVISQSTGVEELFDEIEAVLIAGVNDALDQVYARREAADMERAQRRNEVYVPIEYDPIPPEHFHTGGFPSLIVEEAPMEVYPYIAMTFENYVPDGEDARNDHMNVYRDVIMIHCMASATDDEGSEVLFRRCIRMGEAVYLTLMSDPILSKKLDAGGNPVRGQASMPFKKVTDGQGDPWWFQSYGTQYAIKSYTTMWG